MKCKFVLLSILFLILFSSCEISPLGGNKSVSLSRSDVIIRLVPPPGRSSIGFTGAPLRALIQNPDDWTITRSNIDYIGYYAQILGNPRIFSDDELNTFFALISNTPHLKLSLYVGVLKDFTPTGEQGFAFHLPHWIRIEEHGGIIFEMLMDEPLRSAIYEIPGYTFEDAVRETADWIELVRQRYPSSAFRIGSTEPYPCFSSAMLISWIDGLNAECASRGIRGIDFFEIDPNWNIFSDWSGVLEIEEHCNSIGLPFTLIYWAAEHCEPEDTDEDYYIDIHSQGVAYRAAGGAPDEYTIINWNYIPYQTIPETEAYSFTYSFRSFYNVFIDENSLWP